MMRWKSKNNFLSISILETTEKSEADHFANVSKMLFLQ